MLDRIPKPVLIGVVAVIVVLALMIVMKSVKSAGGAGDYDGAEIKRLAAERNKDPNGGRKMPDPGSMRSNSSGYPSSGGASGSGGYPSSGGR